MRTYLNAKGLVISIIILMLCSCKKNAGEKPLTGNSRLVKYEITGNFTGKLLVVYTDNVTGNTILNNISIPWSKQISYPETVSGIGVSANAITTGSSGQTAIMTIYVAGIAVQSSSAVAGANGELSFRSLSHNF